MFFDKKIDLLYQFYYYFNRCSFNANIFLGYFWLIFLWINIEVDYWLSLSIKTFAFILHKLALNEHEKRWARFHVPLFVISIMLSSCWIAC